MLAVKVEQVAKTFEEDRVVIEEQFQRRQEDPLRPLVDIRSDGPSLAARRILAALCEREAETLASLTGWPVQTIRARMALTAKPPQRWWECMWSVPAIAK